MFAPVSILMGLLIILRQFRLACLMSSSLNTLSTWKITMDVFFHHRCGNSCCQRVKLRSFACANRIVYIGVLECRRVGRLHILNVMVPIFKIHFFGFLAAHYTRHHTSCSASSIVQMHELACFLHVSLWQKRCDVLFTGRDDVDQCKILCFARTEIGESVPHRTRAGARV